MMMEEVMTVLLDTGCCTNVYVPCCFYIGGRLEAAAVVKAHRHLLDN